MQGFIPFLLDTIVTPSGTEATQQTTTATAGGGLFGSFGANNPVMLIVIYCVALLLVMYFLSIRPTQKKEKKLAEMRNAVEVGDTIITNSGFYGKVVDITYDCLIVEFGLNKGVRIPVAKTEIFGKAEPNMSNEAPPELEQPKKRGLFKKAEE